MMLTRMMRKILCCQSVYDSDKLLYICKLSSLQYFVAENIVIAVNYCTFSMLH